MKRLFYSAVSLSLMLSWQTANAAFISAISSSADQNRCKATSAVKLNVIVKTPDDPQNDPPLNANTYASTTCGNNAGGGEYWYGGNTLPKPDEMLGNVGLRNDGFMNMSTSTLATLRANAGNSIIDGYGYSDFINESDLVELGTNYQESDNGKKYDAPDPFNPTDGLKDDPGWIKLGEVEDFPGDQSDTKVKNSSLSDILEISFESDQGNSSGFWTLTVKEEAIALAEGILGRSAVFDHLAIVLKASDNVGIYDFNFNDIFGTPVKKGIGVDAAGNGFEQGFNYSTPYTFSGSWNTSELGNAGLSHWSIYARDPIIQNLQVPAPGAAGLFLMMLGGIWLRMRCRTAK